MALLTAYFDESGIHEGDHWCVVAGFIGTDEQWQAVAADWIPAILPRKNLHMKALRWKQHPDRITRVMEKVCPIPSRYNLTPVLVSLRWSDYNKFVKGKLRDKFTNPYMLCALCCMTSVLTEIANTDDVYFLFDRQEGLRRETMNTLKEFVFEKIGVDSRVKGIDFIHRTSTVCLDAPDCLAFTFHEQHIDEHSFKATAGQAILTRKVCGGKIGPQQLQEMVDELTADGFSFDKPLPAKIPAKTIKSLMSNPYWRGPK